MRVKTSLVSTLSSLTRFFKKIKLDNFVGGLIVGAVFSLVVNVATIQVQESIDKQRVLESIEREIAGHLLDTSSFSDDYDSTTQKLRDDPNYRLDKSIYLTQRFDTRVWDSSEISKYIFELDPKIAGDLSIYYDTLIDGYNRLLDDNQASVDRIYVIKCDILNSFIDNSFTPNLEDCNALQEASNNHLFDLYRDVNQKSLSVLKTFHPTQDRLDSLWLRTLMGGDSVKILTHDDTTSSVK